MGLQGVAIAMAMGSIIGAVCLLGLRTTRESAL